MPTEEDIIRATLKDLTEDLESIANAAYAEAVRVRKAYKSDTKDDIVSKTAQDVIVLYETLAHNARNELEASAHWSEEDISRLVAMKNHCAISMREVANLAGAAMTARSWQAPGTGVDMAMKARILTFFDENPNNYKRGGFSESTDYERRFAKEYIDGSMIPPQVHLTSSGMSACLTALVHLKSKKRPRNKPHHVLVGASTYFENLWLLQQLFQGEITSVDEADEERILSLVKEMQPSILLFDTVTYSSSLIVPNWGTLVKKLSHALTGPSTLILDNSYMGAGYQPLADMPWSVTGMDLIVVESLNKFYEFGTDRVSGGVIWTTRNIDGSIQVARNHCGTMLAEASVAALPLPSRARFDQRMTRIDRNATYIAERINSYLMSTPTRKKVDRVIHPSLTSHPGYEWTKDMGFKGGCITISFKPKYSSAFYYSQYLARAMYEADARGVIVQQGTSFGLDTTRLSIAAFYSEASKRFIRISIGTETKSQVEKLAQAFIAAIE